VIEKVEKQVSRPSMTTRTISLPVLPTHQPLHLTPTDVTSFVRAEQCERFLRFRLAERAGQKFMEPYDVAPQRITPLLSLSGRTFEEEVEDTLEKRFRTIHFAALAGFAHDRPNNNADVVAETKALKSGAVVVLFQTRLEAALDGWQLRGDVDLIRLHRPDDGTLDILIADLKSTTEVRVEHRLQVAFYWLMREKILADASIAHHPIRLGIIYRPPPDPEPEDAALVEAQRRAADDLFGLADAALEVVADPDAYLRSVRDLVLDEASVARRVAATPFESIPFCLSFKCDQCLYNEFCMKWSAEQEDLSLLPFMNGTDKEVLRKAGITTIKSLATLKEPAPESPTTAKGDLVPAPGREAEVRRLAAIWPVGPRLDELVHRARAFRRFARRDDIAAFPFIPGRGNSTLPAVRPDANPNLVWVYVEAQHDYLNDRVYMLAALVVGCKNGVPDPARRRTVVHLTNGPPESAAQERQLFIDWTRDVVKAVVELADSRDEPKAAPIHFVFFERHEQKLLLDALARNFPPILKATPPLYDFLTQLAAFDSPIATYLSEEVRESKNYPMTCQSLQSLAAYLKFDWNAPLKFRDLFKTRLFDYLGKIDLDGQSEWYTRRSRFSSSIPLEYSYAAWGQLPKPVAGRGDEFEDYRHLTLDQLKAFAVRRLEAIEHVTARLTPNQGLAKSPFVLPDLARFEDKAATMAHALLEFVTIERLVAMSDWRGIRHQPPERRVLMGETLLIRYREADQPAEELDRIRQAHAGAKLKLGGLRLRLRVEVAGIDCDLHDALALSDIRDGDRLVMYPRWAVDERLAVADRKPFSPTPKQLLYGMRVDLTRLLATARDDAGRVTEAFAEVEVSQPRFVRESHGFVFGGFDRPLEDGSLYTLDGCPDDWYGLWCRQVVDAVSQGQPNVLYDRLIRPPAATPPAPLAGQARFLEGLDAFHRAGHLHDFEPGKREFIGNHGYTPTLLVQGPPGTGKSHSAAFAVFARLQGAMKAKRPYRVFLSCKTHAATDVLLKNVLEVQKKLRELRDRDAALFAKYFDERLLTVPLFRVAPNDPQPDGITALVKDAAKEKGEDRNADLVMEPTWTVVGVTPGGVYGMVKAKWPKAVFGSSFCDLLVLDEASQMNLPEALMAAIPLKPDGLVVVVGDHRQMPPIVRHDWDNEGRRTFKKYAAFASLFDTLRLQGPPMIRFTESFRLHATVAEFLREEIYRHDGISFHSRRRDVLEDRTVADPLVAATLLPEFPLVVVVHEEASSQVRNTFEQSLIEPIIRVLTSKDGHNLDAEEGLGVVVPHRAQRAALQGAFPELCVIDAATGLPSRSAIDTVERFQGGERRVILVSATESDPSYLLASSGFLLDPRRLTVAVSRAKRKLIVVAARSIFALFHPDEETFSDALLWKNLLVRACPTLLWHGDRSGTRVSVWGGS
jgi:hypothetical protein